MLELPIYRNSMGTISLGLCPCRAVANGLGNISLVPDIMQCMQPWTNSYTHAHPVSFLSPNTFHLLCSPLLYFLDVLQICSDLGSICTVWALESFPESMSNHVSSILLHRSVLLQSVVLSLFVLSLFSPHSTHRPILQLVRCSDIVLQCFCSAFCLFYALWTSGWVDLRICFCSLDMFCCEVEAWKGYCPSMHYSRYISRRVRPQC